MALRIVGITIVAVEEQLMFRNSEFMSVALVIQHAMRMRHFAICSLSRSAVVLPFNT